MSGELFFEQLAASIVSLDDDAQYGLRAAAEAITPPPGDRGGGGDHVGIWDIEADGGEETWTPRPELSVREQHSWRAVPLSSRRAAPDCLRVALLGSSAAASYGHWLDFSLASVIERKLAAACASVAVEVLDLACVNATWADSLDVLRHAAGLRPDVVLFYAGNNEAKLLLHRLRSGELRHLESSFGAEAVEAAALGDRLRLCLADHFAHMVRRTVDEARRLRLPIVFVVPQTNLSDWRGPERMPAGLTGATLREWWTTVTAGEEHLAHGEHEAAARRFEAAIALDAGRCQRSLYGLADALRMGDAAPQRQSEAYTLARDAGLGPFVRGVPQVTQGAADAMRDCLRQLDVPFVDLAALAAGDGGGPSDRRFFLDYCHLSAEGIDALARELARLVLRERVVVERVGEPALDALEARAVPGERAEALAAWVAAIHNYHHGQSLEITAHWLRVALRVWPPIRPLLAFLSPALWDPWRERYTVRFFQDAGLHDLLGERHFAFFAKFFYHARFDYKLARVIDELLEMTDADPPPESLGTLRDLGGRLYSLFFGDMRQGFVTGDRSAPRGGWELPCLELDATEFSSVVDFPADGPADAVLTVEMSAPPGGSCRCEVELNSTSLAAFDVSPRWSRRAIPVPAATLARGVNHLRFAWSALTGPSDFDTPASRAMYISAYGYHPVAARIHALNLDLGEIRC